MNPSRNRPRTTAVVGAVALFALLAGCATRKSPSEAGKVEASKHPSSAEAGVKPNAEQPESLRVYVGTYTGPKSKGIYLFDFDLATGALAPAGLAGEVDNPSFLALSPDARTLFAAGEVGEFNGKPTGVVSAFAIDPATGNLTLLNQRPSGGGGPCHVSTGPAGRAAFVANYGGGSVSSIPVSPDGTLGEPASVIQHETSTDDAGKKQEPRGHWIAPDPSGRFVLACDLGLDQVLVYQFDAGSGKLTPNDPPFGRTAPGAGPRHAAFSPDGKFLHVINEMGMTVTTFAWDATTGALTNAGTVSTLPPGYKGEGLSTAEIVAHPSGKFVYGSNRGPDSIAAFTVDPATGQLTPAGHTPTGGKTPRNFNVDPTGQWLIAANQDSDTLVVFKIDPETGALTQAGPPVEAPAPVCITFAPAGK